MNYIESKYITCLHLSGGVLKSQIQNSAHNRCPMDILNDIGRFYELNIVRFNQYKFVSLYVFDPFINMKIWRQREAEYLVQGHSENNQWTLSSREAALLETG
jgi:hypothetical protein